MDRKTRTFAILMLCTLIGVIIAVIVQEMYTRGILIDEFITATLTLREVQLVIIVMWTMLGIGVSASER